MDEPQPGAPAALRALPTWLLNQAALHASRLVRDELAATGLRRQDYATLVTLREAGALSQAALGRRLAMDRSDMHAVLAVLEDRGLVARERDPGDRRRNVIELTRAGTAALARLDTRVHEAQAALLQPLKAGERRELQRLLTVLVDHHGPER